MINRHPILGLLSGFLLGVGLALIMVQLAIVPFGSWTVVAVIVIFTLLGLIFALAIPMRGAPPPATTYQHAPPTGGYQQPPAAAPAESAAPPPPPVESAAPPPAPAAEPPPPADEPPATAGDDTPTEQY